VWKTGLDSDFSWMSFNISRHEGEGDPYNSFSENRLVRVAVSIPEDFCPWWLKHHPEHNAAAIEKYHSLKLLFENLHCDSLDGNSDSFDRGVYEGDPDPGFEGKLFRFAKQGRQVLIRPLEERRAMRDDEEHSWRVVVD
jgi:hypothetical protein